MVIGYTAGTFDMFHIGHLNFLNNAKKNCDLLIVGVNTDALVEQYKGKSAIIPFVERIQIVQAIRCVDKTIEVEHLEKIPYAKQLAFHKLFIGSDWIGNERWERTKKEMESLNIELVYLPYTSHISSTKVKEKCLSH